MQPPAVDTGYSPSFDPAVMAQWKTFEEAVAAVYGNDSETLITVLEIKKSKPVPSPRWDERAHRAALAGGKPAIQVLDGKNWVEAQLSPPSSVRPDATGSSRPGIVLQPGSRSILFMDVSGWSKLTMTEIHDFVSKAMPAFEQYLEGRELVNTWGDAIVATFESATTAAEAALSLRDHFPKAYPHEGVPTGTSCRIALHHAEVLVGTNPLTLRQDVFGHGVHVAARLEPVTGIGQVFCTSDFAARLGEMTGRAPKAWPYGEMELAKGFGRTRVYVVTWPNEGQPPEQPSPVTAHPTPTKPIVSARPAPLDLDKALLFGFAPTDDLLVIARKSHTSVSARLWVVNCTTIRVTVNNVHLRWVIGDADGETMAKGDTTLTPLAVTLEPGERCFYHVDIRADCLGGSLPPFRRFGASGDYVATGEAWERGKRGEVATFLWGYAGDARNQ
jgi:class 3 adenylate cyclase